VEKATNVTRFGLTLAVCLVVLAAAGPAWGAPPAPGLVAAYSFDEGSGSAAVDASGNGHTGAITGATWTSSGRYGGALSFDGVDDSVGLGSLGGFSQTAFTLQAWVQKATTKNDVAILGSWTGSGPMLWVDHLASRYHLTLAGSLSNYLDSGHNPVPASWQHLAATYDGTTAHFYIDGTQVASRTTSGPGNSDTWRIGAYGSTPGGFFDGLIDDIRIYDRALTATEIQTDMTTPVTIANSDIPTEPGSFVVTDRTKTSLAVSWAPSTDDFGVTGYTVYRDGAPVQTTTETTFVLSGLTCSSSYELGVEALDGDGNTSTRALTNASTSLCDGPLGLVAAYSFDEGSGSAAVDASGNGHTGAITGATWTSSGRYGGALSFDGVDDSVGLGSLGGFSQTAFTLQAWVQKATTKNDVAILGSWTGSGPMLWVDHLASRYHLTLAGSLSNYLDSGHNPVPASWQHLAATYDGTTAHFYIDGTQVASRTTSGPGNSDTWRIGAYGSTPGGFFDGLIDDIRIYDRALTATEIQTDMNQPVPPEDTTPPAAPSGLTANGAIERATLAWTAASDDVRLAGYNVYRSTTAGFTPSASNRIAQTTGTSHVDTGVASGTYHYLVTAEDGAGNVGPASNEATAVVAPDSNAPTVAITAPAGGTLSGQVPITATAFDDQAVAGVQFRLDGQSLGPEDTTAPYSIDWDTRSAINDPHTLTAVARDGAGNTTTSAPRPVSVSNPGVSTTGLRAAYALDDGTGTLARDSSQSHRTGTLAGATWSADGRFGGAGSFSGSAAHIDLPALGTFYKTAFTYEAWVFKQSSKLDVGIVGTWVDNQAGGPMLWIDHANGRYQLTLGHNPGSYLDSGQAAAVGRWQHVAATYDGATARIYVDGLQAASLPFTGNPGNSNTWRIGAYGATAGGFFDGLVDDIRIYDRALTAAEIQTDLASRIQPDRVPPVVAAREPAAGATSVGVGRSLTVRFDEPMRASTLTPSAFSLTDQNGAPAPFSVSYDQATNTATLALDAALLFGTGYTAVVKGGSATDLAGNALPADVSWSITTETAPPPVLLLTSAANPFTTYLGEILRSEGLTSFSAISAPLITPTLLSHFDVVVVGETALTAGQVATLTGWVNAGGNLIAMRPDKQLAGLLGLTSGPTTLTNAYLRVETGTGPGAGIVPDTIQYHGTADRYTLSGAVAIARLFTTATASTTSPAVSLRSVGTNGGQAAAFTYDLARSVVYTRQGNPAWAGQERDGAPGLRPGDLFFGAKVGDVQPDWINTNKLAIPQADEQQRLLVNLITLMGSDAMPLPRFWYLPRGEKAVVVLSGDDHSPVQSSGATASNFDRLKVLSPPACVVAKWDCVRSTSYIYPDSVLTNAQAAAYVSEGFEIALHSVVAACPTTAITTAELHSIITSQVSSFTARYTSVPPPATSRLHCVYWPDWASTAKVEQALGIRMDANYYHYPGAWIGSKPGFLNGGGFPMRFADLDGAVIDVYQQNTNLTDESGQSYPLVINTLLDNAIGSKGFYGAFGANIHTDNAAPNADAEEIIASAQARSVPVVSYKQMLDWVDGRNASSIRGLEWSSDTLSFEVSVGTGADGLQTMLPVDGPTGMLTAIFRAGAAVPFVVQTIKGIRYAFFDATTASYEATYATSSPVAGLVGAYSFDAGAGISAADTSGRGNNGTISGATWNPAGRFGSALSFDAANELVTIPDSDSLDLTTGMTIEAWVNPSALGSTWRTVVLKEQPGNLSYALYAGTDSGLPSGHVFIGSDLDTRGPTVLPLNTWTHLATTFDGANLRLYVDGTQVSIRPISGSIVTSAGALRLGGNTVWAEWFDGLIDEVRIYDRALSAVEIQVDMNQPLTP
jgi:hypothetical protein